MKLHGSLDPHESDLQQHLDRFSHFAGRTVVACWNV